MTQQIPDLPPLVFKEITNSRGKLKERHSLKERKITGVSEYYDPKTQLLKQRVSFLENQRQGPTLIYDKSGNIVQKLEFHGGKLQGNSEYYRDGNLYAILPFLEGKLNGIATYYDAGGNKRMEVSFAQGLLHGEMILYNALGYVVKVIFHKKGKKQGIATSYYPSGAILKTEPYLNNLLEGNVTQYYEDGRVCSWHLYQGGKLMEGPRLFNQKSQEIVFPSSAG